MVEDWNTRPPEDALRAELEQARARIAELEAENRWIPVGEQLPEEGQIVEVDFGDNEISVGLWFAETMDSERERPEWQCWNFSEDRFRVCYQPVNWRPLPAPPEEEK